MVVVRRVVGERGGGGGVSFEAKPNYCVRVVRLRSPEFL